ncbi:amidohydrolase family protein [Flavilitoribacter nigricans]|nr:membrane dipeptidase [Flavilitoribacter nigricans]
MEKYTFLDLHCHPFMKAYAHSFKSDGPTYKNSNHYRHRNSSWWSDRATARDLKKHLNGLFGLTHFTQADVRTSLQGNVGVVFSSLYPLEHGFTVPMNCDGPLADTLLDGITQFGKPRINFIQALPADPYDGYWYDLQQEYAFQKAHSGNVKEIYGKSYRYQFVNNYREMEALLTSEDHQVQNLAVINTIEGAHCFGSGIAPFCLPKRLDEILERVRSVKQDWEYPPFFITLAHHFKNEICGHAKSLGMAGVLLNQRPGLNTGITSAGWKIIDLLLNENTGRRVLIDVKHMSLQARKQYYQFIAQKHQYAIPIIVSHGCVTGYDDKENSQHKLSAVPGKPHRKFCSDDINFFDSEILAIQRSGGIFGIQLDEKRISSKQERRRVKRVDPRYRLLYSSKLVWNQIQHIAQVLDQAGLPAWNIQSLGSDFDGIINPIDGCFTAEYYQNLSQFLLIHARYFVTHEMSEKIKLKENRIPAEAIVQRFFHQNAMDFLRKYFREKDDYSNPVYRVAKRARR